MTQFYFVLTNPEAEAMLKSEISQYYPDLKFSYSRTGFITYKGPVSQSFNPYMCRLSGICLGKVEKFPEQFWLWKRDPGLNAPLVLQEISDKTIYKIGQKVSLVMMTGPEEFWLGEYVLKDSHFQTSGEVSSILERDDIASRAYYKIAEAFEAFDLEVTPNAVALELGSAPGGATKFLLEQDLRVIGVDPAQMDAEVLKNPNFRHLKRPFETLTENDFVSNVDYLFSDVNLPPTVVLAQVKRLLSFIKPKILVITLKLNQDKHLEILDSVARAYKGKGFSRVELKYLPSHRQEIALVCF